MIGPAQLDITICKGQDFLSAWQLFDDTNTDTPVSLAGGTVTAKIRNDVEDVAAIADFTCTVTDGPNGEFTIAMPAATTAGIATDNSAPKKRAITKYLWDCYVTYSDGVEQRIFEGFCYIDPGVSY
jgi:hypothetical protein